MVFRIVSCAFLSVMLLPAEPGESHLTFSKRTQVPGKQLKPGGYSFRVLGKLQDRMVIEVRADKDARPVATFLAVPDQKLVRNANNEPVYWRAGNHPVIRGMWISDPPVGAQFVFEKEEAVKLAKLSREPVPAIDPASEHLKPLPAMSETDRNIVTLWLLSAVAVTPGGDQVGIEAAKYVPPAAAPAPRTVESPISGTVSEAALEKPQAVVSPRVTESPVRPRIAKAGPGKPKSPAQSGQQPDRLPSTASNWLESMFAGFAMLLAGVAMFAGVRNSIKA